MKKSILLLLASMLICVGIFANNGTPNSTEPEKEKEKYSVDDIFINDYEGQTLFIDFEPIHDEILSIKILKEDKVLLTDLVSDLPHSTIYEINFELLRQGDYIIELETRYGGPIQKEISID